MYVKGASPIFSTFFQTFGDFVITRKLIFFSYPVANLTAEKCSVSKILMKTCLVTVTMKDIGNCNI